MLTNMNLSTRLYLGFGSLMVMMLIISVVGDNRASIIDQNLKAVSEGAAKKQRYAINFRGSVHDRAISIRDAVLVDNDKDLDKHIEEIEVLKKFYIESAGPMADLMSLPEVTEKEKELLAVIEDIEQKTLRLTDQVIDLRQAGANEQARLLLLNDVAPNYSAWLKSINNFIDYQEVKIRERIGIVESVANGFTNLVLLITGLAIIIGLIISFLIVRWIKRIMGGEPSEIRDIALDLANGKLDTNIKSDLMKGSIIEALSLTKANIESTISEVSQVMKSMAAGNLGNRIQSDFKGDLSSLKESINSTADAMQQTMLELSQVFTSLSNGQFDQKSDKQFKGGFKQMMDNAEIAMSSLKNSISAVVTTMTALQEGRFDSRITEDLKGDLSLIKASVNASVESLDNFFQEVNNVVNLQSQGDLTQSIQNEYPGELKVLSNALNKTLESLGGTLTEILSVSNHVSTASSEVSGGASDLNNRTQRMAASIQVNASSMEEITSTVKQNSHSAKLASTETQAARKEAADASLIAKQAVEAMEKITESSQKIADIITLIDSIAFQTNLLALNAAVEAARAGEHGRGFAVVAGEVRSLAQKSAEASREIKTLIEMSVENVESGGQFVNRTGEALDAINLSIEKVSGLINEIAVASDEQFSGIDQVNRALTDLDSETQQNAALVEETTAASEKLNDQSNTLRERISFFKIKDSRQIV